ncbi:type I-C CRISPR-associated protein Cas8c/Csd1 [Corallococcus sp. CA053C]|uniref:type I-C CRISPR-associated protein Cas8c/Csd1 n=1 Tax=Corallococcus sp. CA053C TaxID=2316732 RepID=UPI000EA2BBDE|nr:type I-C CRISPR-associated protein Cas8c/Csd1 [Corallococcus sp. CA053C]RKH15205.1 type I-C CRISPR-associated protein Cas8c/Csd1 [Corallococcus sp. CA053C]
MMLQALNAYARREGLLEDPDVELLSVDALIEVADDGRFLSLMETADEHGRVPKRAVPRIPKRTVAILPGFFVDNARYVLGWGGDAAKARKNPERAAAFRAVVEAVAKETNDPGARAVAAFLAKLDSQLPRLLKQRAEWTGEERLVFSWSGDDGGLVHERPALREAWARKRGAEAQGAEDATRMRCLVTGEVGPVARLHPSIKNVPGAQSSGAALVSFNEEAFCSHGLTQGENAPISRAAAEGYATALNHMLSRDATRRYRRGVALGEGAVAVFWTREADPVVDTLLNVLDPVQTQQAVHFAEAPLRGLEPGKFDATPFYALTLGGNAARVVVRDWLESSIQDLKHNVLRYFEDLRLVGGRGRPLSVWQLLRAVEPPGRQGNPPGLAAKLLGAALGPRPFPRELLSAALRRLRVPEKDDAPAFLLHARCALIKATLLRLPRGTAASPEVSVSLSPDSPEVSYQLGRLFAALERLQYLALGDVNASIKDRYFGAAMANPGVVLPRLVRLSTHHAAKAERAGWLERLMGQIMGQFPAKTWPSTLTLEAQGLFAVGYYHQREEFFRKAPPAGAPAVES